jgi:hypothetical protein
MVAGDSRVPCSESFEALRTFCAHLSEVLGERSEHIDHAGTFRL